ncbi:hypothetical protein AVEN_37523-1 [Araneus ventricosus]|uniref:Uncharacterized protein n=1 Tax=Araneus ventricosus TaxID=182803 RepID=A0A4Y2J3V9_ARAVE|nr:hypothetical protein AVEN_37523-1 [Araneus ventricosus]
MAIHAPEKHLSKSHCIDDFDNLDVEPHYFKEKFENDEECFALDTRIAYEQISPPPLLKNEAPSAQSIEAVQEKIVENIAFEIWPKVLAILQKTNSSHVPEYFKIFLKALSIALKLVKGTEWINRSRTRSWNVVSSRRRDGFRVATRPGNRE